MGKIKKAAALALVLATCGVVRAADSDVLQSLPEGALVAGKVANLTATSAKIAKLAKDLGIDAFVPTVQNPLGTVKAQMHIEKGLNEAGEFGFAYLSPKTTGAPEDESFVVLFPVSNYAEFLGNFGEAKTEAGISEVSSPENGGGGKPLFLADWGGYAALSPAKALVAKPTATLKTEGLAAKEAGRQDFIVYANFKQLSPELMPELDKGMAKAFDELEKAGADKFDPKYKPIIKAAATQLFAVGKTFLNDADAATVGLNISDAGINTTVVSDFKPDTYLGKTALSMKNTDKPLTVGLPAIKYLVYGGSTNDAAATGKLFDDLSAPIVAELQKLEGAGDIKKIVDSLTTALKSTTGTTFAAPAPTKIGQEGIFQQVTIYHGGGPDYKSAFAQSATLAKQFIADMKLPADRPKPTFDMTQNTKSIEGVSFDSFKFEAKPSPDAPNAAQQEQMMNLFYGPDGMTYDYGVMGQDFIVNNGASNDTVAAFIKAAKAGEDNLSKLDQVKVVTAELPKSRLVEYYVALDEIVNTGVSTAAQFGLPVQVQLPPELPPLGVTFGTDATALRFDIHLPTTTVQSLIAAGMQAFMGMRGGGNL